MPIKDSILRLQKKQKDNIIELLNFFRLNRNLSKVKFSIVDTFILTLTNTIEDAIMRLIDFKKRKNEENYYQIRTTFATNLARKC